MDDPSRRSAARRGARALTALAAASLAAAAGLSCSGEPFDPLARARAAARPVNLDAQVPPACYAKTDGGKNACYVCHTLGVGDNTLADVGLQSEYSFSEAATRNAWTNLFEDRSRAIASISDQEILDWIRGDNYGPLRRDLAQRRDYPGFVPDLDLDAGFDEAGFARDGSGFRAVRYKPFPGAFWPTNGSAGDVMIRLPRAFRVDADGRPSLDVYRVNLAVLEAAVASAPSRPAHDLARAVEPVSEAVAGADLDGDGRIGMASQIRRLPERYAGGARDVPVHRYRYPKGTELLHTVRYLDPDQPTLLSRRLKELRYMRKTDALDDWAIQRAYEKELEEKEEGRPAVYPGAPEVGLKNAFGWQIQGFIEDERGRLRLQTAEEHRFCMGCHNGIGVTVDQTFSVPRKVPGAAGWRHQDIAGIPDVPQVGQAKPEVLTYFERAGGGDDFGANTEVLSRFFPGGVLDEAAVRRAAPGGDRDLAYLVAPSRARALLLDKAYFALVRTQRFDLGRDAVPAPVAGAVRSVNNGPTGLAEAKKTYLDGRLHLDWSGVPAR